MIFSLQVIVHFKSQTISKKLPKSLHSLGIALCKGGRKAPGYAAISRAAFRINKLHKNLVNQSCLQLQKECSSLARKKNSILKSTSLRDLKRFSWSRLLKEWKKEATTLFQYMKATAVPSHVARIKSHPRHKSLRPLIGAAGAILLKGRNQRLSAVQHLVGLCLFLGSTKKKVTKHHSFI